jgi:hypothetical protein
MSLWQRGGVPSRDCPQQTQGTQLPGTVTCSAAKMGRAGLRRTLLQPGRGRERAGGRHEQPRAAAGDDFENQIGGGEHVAKGGPVCRRRGRGCALASLGRTWSQITSYAQSQRYCASGRCARLGGFGRSLWPSTTMPSPTTLPGAWSWMSCSSCCLSALAPCLTCRGSRTGSRRGRASKSAKAGRPCWGRGGMAALMPTVDAVMRPAFGRPKIMEALELFGVRAAPYVGCARDRALCSCSLSVLPRSRLSGPTTW